MKHNDSRYYEINQFTRSTASQDTIRKVVGWPESELEIGECQREYDRTVSFYIREGNALLTLGEGETVEVVKGDFIRIEKGASIHWLINETIKDTYMYHDSFTSAASRKAQVYWNNDSSI